MTKWMQHSGEETTKRTQTVEYPERPRTLQHCTKEGRVPKANQKHITRAVTALEEHTHPSKALKHLSREGKWRACVSADHRSDIE